MSFQWWRLHDEFVAMEYLKLEKYGVKNDMLIILGVGVKDCLLEIKDYL